MLPIFVDRLATTKTSTMPSSYIYDCTIIKKLNEDHHLELQHGLQKKSGSYPGF